MGNTRAQDRRRGVKRPGPAQRAHLQSPLQPTASLVAARENAAERQRQCRARKRNLNIRSEHMALLREGGELVNPGRRDVLRVSTKICSFIVAELENDCAGPRFRAVVLEQLSGTMPLLHICRSIIALSWRPRLLIHLFSLIRKSCNC